MPQGSDVHQRQMLEEKKQRWSHNSLEHKVDLILDRLDRLERRVIELSASMQGAKPGARLK